MTIDQYIDDNKSKFIDELLSFLRIPSVSTDSKYESDILKAANFVADSLKKLEATKVQLFATDGHPVVYGEKIISDDLPTVLVYGHYDVQPPDPIDLWDNPPFEPIIKDNKIFARGACDDKGQMYMHIKAIETLLKTKNLNCNVKFIFEGEEEIASRNLPIFLEKNKDMLKADVALLSDTAMPNNETPAITVGLRGIIYLEVEITACNQDLHSGVYGGAAPNPIQILSEMIAQLKDKDGRILVPHFYDKVNPLSDGIRTEIAKDSFDSESLKKDLGVDELICEKGYTPLECMTVRPTLDFNGIWGGYIDEGEKTVIPARVNAKLSMRLVADQDPEEIAKHFINFFKSIAPKGVKLKFIKHQGGHAITVPFQSKAFQAAADSYSRTFQKEPLKIYCGGSIPVVALFKNLLNIDTILMGFGLNSDNIHAPNEHYGIYNYMIGIKTISHFYQYYSEL